MKKVAVIGNGYVGKGMVRLFARAFTVGVYDINDGPDRSAVSGADLAVICVPTAQRGDGAADTSIVEEVVKWCDAPLICIKSTVPPGTTDRLAAETGKAVHFSPEYMGEPKNFVAPWRNLDPADASSHPFVTVGGPRADDVLAFFAKVMATDARFIACQAIEAEIAKYMENAYFATKVTFCNEFARIAEAFGASYLRVRELWAADPRVNADHTMVFPDRPGFDGKCLPKDLSAIVTAARRAGFDPMMLSAVQQANAKMRGA